MVLGKELSFRRAVSKRPRSAQNPPKQPPGTSNLESWCSRGSPSPPPPKSSQKGNCRGKRARTGSELDPSSGVLGIYNIQTLSSWSCQLPATVGQAPRLHVRWSTQASSSLKVKEDTGVLRDQVTGLRQGQGSGRRARNWNPVCHIPHQRGKGDITCILSTNAAYVYFLICRTIIKTSGGLLQVLKR